MKAKFESGRVTMILLLATLLTTELTFSQIIEITKPYENRESVFLLELNDSSRIQFNNNGASFDSLTYLYKGSTIYNIDTVVSFEYVRRPYRLIDILVEGRIVEFETDVKVTQNSEFNIVFDNQTDSIYATEKMVLKNRKEKYPQIVSNHLRSVRKIKVDMDTNEEIITNKKIVTNQTYENYLYHIDLNLGLTDFGFGGLVDLPGLKLGFKLNFNSLYNGIDILTGVEGKISKGILYINSGLSFIWFDKSERSNSNEIYIEKKLSNRRGNNYWIENIGFRSNNNINKININF
jgi:hypothetical protein